MGRFVSVSPLARRSFGCGNQCDRFSPLGYSKSGFGTADLQASGPSCRNNIRCYGGNGGLTPESWEQTKKAGFTASRVGVPRGSVTEMIEYTKALRKAAGPKHDIAIHMSGTLTTREAVQCMKGVEECHLLFVEEPIQMDDLEDWAHLRAHTTTPIAADKRLITKWEFAPYCFRPLLDFVQPDLCATGGITQTKKIATIAETCRIQLAPHNPHGPAGALATFHLDAAIPNYGVQECGSGNYTSQQNMDLHEGMVPIIKDGYCKLHDRPGFGTVLNEKVAATRPYVPVTRTLGTMQVQKAAVPAMPAIPVRQRPAEARTKP